MHRQNRCAHRCLARNVTRPDGGRSPRCGDWAGCQASPPRTSNRHKRSHPRPTPPCLITNAVSQDNPVAQHKYWAARDEPPGREQSLSPRHRHRCQVLTFAVVRSDGAFDQHRAHFRGGELHDGIDAFTLRPAEPGQMFICSAWRPSQLRGDAVVAHSNAASLARVLSSAGVAWLSRTGLHLGGRATAAPGRALPRSGSGAGRHHHPLPRPGRLVAARLDPRRNGAHRLLP